MHWLRRWGAALLHELSLMRTAVLLLALAAVASMAGTVVVQGLPIQNYVTEFGPFWATVLWYAGLTEVFTAWWFLGLMAVLVLSVSTCVVRNGPHVYRHWCVPRQVPPLSAGMVVPQVTAAQLRAAGFGLVGQVGNRVLWQRGGWNRVGYFAVHIGVVGVAVAGLVSGLVGWRGNLNLREGETDNVVLRWQGEQPVPFFLPFQVKLEAFEIDFFPGGMPSRYASKLVLTGTPEGRRDVVVEVNKPVTVRMGWLSQFTLYQASFGDGGSTIQGRGLDVATGQLTPLTGKIYEQAQLPDGTRLELLEFRPFTVETMRGERPQDVGPSVDYLVQPPDRPAVQLRAYLNHVDFIGVADGQKMGGMDAGAVVYRPVLVGLPRAELWPVAAAVSRLASPTEVQLRRLLTPALAPAATEAERVAAGLGVLQAARVLRELNLSHVLVLDDFTLRRYTGLMVAYDPAVQAFWVASLLLLVGVVLMLGRRMSRVWLAADGSALVTSPHGRRQVAEVVEELAGSGEETN